MSRGTTTVVAVAGLLALGAAPAVATPSSTSGPMGFTPIAGSAGYTDGTSGDWDPAAPWNVPAGFQQELVSGELSDRCGGDGLNVYGSPLDDWEDMNTVNETGPQAGRYLYRTHEVRLSTPGADTTYPAGGAVSVVDLETCEARVIAQDPTYTALDGIRWTPWGTVLFAEETDGGRLFELVPDPKDPMNGEVVERPAVGNMAHEGIEVGADGSVYVIDEFRGQTAGYGGGIYRFVPDRRGDLSAGDLYALAVDGEDGVGQGQWVGPVDPATAPVSGTEAGGTSYQRPEDVEVIGNTLYVAVTEGLGYGGRVLAVDLGSLQVSNYVKAGANVPAEVKPTRTGLKSPDNLAEGPDHRLWIVEDNAPSDIWVTRGSGAEADSVSLFATLTDPGAEGTGIYFGKDPKTLFVNVQHSAADDGDGTWAITAR
jgi:uncharacterized protein